MTFWGFEGLTGCKHQRDNPSITSSRVDTHLSGEIGRWDDASVETGGGGQAKFSYDGS